MPGVVAPHPRPGAALADKWNTVAVKLAKYSVGAHGCGRGRKGEGWWSGRCRITAGYASNVGSFGLILG